MLLSTRHFAFVGLVVTALVSSGCNQSADSDGPSEMDQLANMLDQPTPEPAPQSLPPVESRRASRPVVAAPPSEERLSNPSRETMEPERKISHVKSGGNRAGVLGKRKYRNEHSGPLRYYGAIASVRVLAEDRAIGWQIKKSMDVYLALHDNKYPKDLDEYMKVIIEENMIQLPELEDRQEFYYDPEDHELKIVEFVDAPVEDDAVDGTAPAQ